MLVEERELISEVQYRLDKFKAVGNKFNFRCPFCGDSQKKQNLARGWLFENGSTVFFKCFNCSLSYNLLTFIKQIDRDVYDRYIFSNFNKRKDGLYKNNYHTSFKNYEINRNDIIRKNYKDITRLEQNHIARAYIEKRMIPSKLHNDIFYAESLDKLLARFKISSNLGKNDCDVIVMPFYYDAGNNYDYIQVRSMKADASFRYLIYKINPDSNRIKMWGYKYLDFNKRINIIEGTIDAMMLDNSISACTSNSLYNVAEYLYKEQGISKSGFCVIYDNDYKSNKYVKNQLIKTIKDDYNVVLYDYLFKSKDLNDAIVSGEFDYNTLSRYIEKHICNGLMAMFKLK